MGAADADIAVASDSGADILSACWGILPEWALGLEAQEAGWKPAPLTRLRL